MGKATRIRPPRDAPFSLADAAWLHMERPNNHFVVTGIMRFDSRIDVGRLVAVYEERLAGFERFRQYVAPSRLPFGTPTWRADPGFEMSRHISEVDLPDRDGALLDYLASAISRPLDESRPLWELHVINGPGPGCILLSRIHHCIGDGMALLNVLMSLTDEGWAARTYRRRRRSGPITTLTPVLAEFSRLVVDGRHRSDSVAYLGRAAKRLARLTLMPFDEPSPFKGTLAEGKRLSWAEPIPIETVRQVGDLTGATINDVMLSCATGAMAAYMEGRGLRGMPRLRATVPYNLRPYERAAALGNGFTLVYLPLALDYADPLLRLAETAERMREIKRSPEALVTNLVLNGIGLLPARLEDLAVRFFGAKASAVITNVPGPERELHLDGHRIREIRFWEPESGSIAMGWSVFSYAGRLCVGVITDAGLVPDPGTLISAFEKELGELAALADVAGRRQRRIRHGNQGADKSRAAARTAGRPEQRRAHARPRAGQPEAGRGAGGEGEHADDQVRRRHLRKGADAGAPPGQDRDQARAVAAPPPPDRLADAPRARKPRRSPAPRPPARAR